MGAVTRMLRSGVVSGDYKLQSLLKLREVAVAAAEQALREAMAQLADHEAEQRRLSVKAHAKQSQLQLLAVSAGGRTASAFVAKDRYAAQLRSELTDAQQALAQHETVFLAASLTLEQQARDELRKAQQESTLINRHREHADKALRKVEERRADNATDDWFLGRTR